MKKTTKHLIIAWLILMIILTIDMITTVEGIKLGAEEANPIGAFFFSFGNIGYIYALIFGGIVVFAMLSLLVKLCNWIYEKREKKKMSNKFKILIYYLFTSILILLESWVIWHNIKIIINLGG